VVTRSWCGHDAAHDAGQSTTTEEGAMTPTTRAVFEAGTEAFNAHDIDAFAALLTDDVVFDVPGGEPQSGKAACAAFYRGWIDAFPDAHGDVDAVHVVDADLIVEEGTFRGRHDGVLHTPSGAIPPTGNAVRIPYVHVLRFRDGKHAALGLMFDRLLMLEQLGLVPTPASR
jgi:steroid delta-isomerase-like uncharacterized protein